MMNVAVVMILGVAMLARTTTPFLVLGATLVAASSGCKTHTRERAGHFDIRSVREEFAGHSHTTMSLAYHGRTLADGLTDWTIDPRRPDRIVYASDRGRSRPWGTDRSHRRVVHWRTAHLGNRADVVTRRRSDRGDRGNGRVQRPGSRSRRHHAVAAPCHLRRHDDRGRRSRPRAVDDRRLPVAQRSPGPGVPGPAWVDHHQVARAGRMDAHTSERSTGGPGGCGLFLKARAPVAVALLTVACSAREPSIGGAWSVLNVPARSDHRTPARRELLRRVNGRSILVAS